MLKFSGPEKLGKRDYFLHLRNAKFCLAPRGESSWTLRFYESFFVVRINMFLFRVCISVYNIQIHNYLSSLLLLFCTEQECVPVILSDQVELPFQDVVDYSQISIKWPSTRIGKELLDYLESISGHSFGLSCCFVSHNAPLLLLSNKIVPFLSQIMR